MELEMLPRTRENLTLSASENDVHPIEQSTMVIELPSAADKFKSKVTSPACDRAKDGADTVLGASDDLKLQECLLKSRYSGNFPMKNKRKRRRGKPKSNTKPYKKSNWKFQKPRSQQSRICDGGGGCGRNGMRSKLVRSRSIVPYNTNDFLMEEHMAEVPGALLTPSARTRDSSFSIDSEDNYFFSLPEDEEEFLTKEFANVYERARVERLEAMSKEQLIEECLQLEHKYADGLDTQVQGNGVNDFINKIRILEDRIRDLGAENYDLRRKLDRRGAGMQQVQEEMCSSASEDSESDSSSSSCSSRSDYSGHSRRTSLSDDVDDVDDDEDIERNGNDLRMDSDDIVVTDQSVNDKTNFDQKNVLCNGLTEKSSSSLSTSASALKSPTTTSPLSPQMNQHVQRSPAQQQQQQRQQQQQQIDDANSIE